MNRFKNKLYNYFHLKSIAQPHCLMTDSIKTQIHTKVLFYFYFLKTNTFSLEDSLSIPIWTKSLGDVNLIRTPVT